MNNTIIIQINTNLKTSEIPFYTYHMTNVSTPNNAMIWQEHGELENNTKIYQ